MKIIEIFDSIDGEGLRTGQLVSFIRTAGCNLRCSYCDTLYSLFGEEEPCEYVEMSVDEVISKINPKFGRVTLTGGEPLISPEASELVNRLCDMGIEVNIETNGAVDVSEFLNKITNSDKMFFTVDYKLPSSGMTDKMIEKNFVSLRPCDVIKFVVGSEEDFSQMVRVMESITPQYEKMPHIYAGVVYGMYEPSELIENMKKTEVLKDTVYQIQLHKVIWSPDKKGV